MARLLLSLALSLALAGCHSRDQDLELLLGKADPVRLRHDAALLYKDAFATRTQGFAMIPRNAWPKSFLALNPARVGAYRDGVAVALSPGTDSEYGFYIIPEGMDSTPVSTERARFRPLRPQIYLYDFGPRRN